MEFCKLCQQVFNAASMLLLRVCVYFTERLILLKVHEEPSILGDGTRCRTSVTTTKRTGLYIITVNISSCPDSSQELQHSNMHTLAFVSVFIHQNTTTLQADSCAVWLPIEMCVLSFVFVFAQSVFNNSVEIRVLLLQLVCCMSCRCCRVD